MMPTTMARATSSSMTSSFTADPNLAGHSPDKWEAAAARLRTRFDIRTGQAGPLMFTALSRMRFIAFAHSPAVVTSSNTNVNSADELDCPTKNPGSSGAPFSREMLCTVLRTQAMFFLLSGFADSSPLRVGLGKICFKKVAPVSLLPHIARGHLGLEFRITDHDADPGIGG